MRVKTSGWEISICDVELGTDTRTHLATEKLKSAEGQRPPEEQWTHTGAAGVREGCTRFIQRTSYKPTKDHTIGSRKDAAFRKSQDQRQAHQGEQGKMARRRDGGGVGMRGPHGSKHLNQRSAPCGEPPRPRHPQEAGAKACSVPCCCRLGITCAPHPDPPHPDTDGHRVTGSVGSPAP